MTRCIRFSLNLNLPATAPDWSPDVKYGVLDGETVFETGRLQTGPRGASHPLARVRLLPPCSPTKIVCVGRNYGEHAAELGNEVPPEPLIFLKPASSLLAHGDDIRYPYQSERVDHEAELGVIIGRRAWQVAKDEALDYIFGYTCVNDVTARDLQKKDDQWTRAKGFDTFCPTGPWAVPRAEVDFDAIHVRAFVDGAKKQDGSVRDMIYPVPRLIEFISSVMTLEPGDLIATGTPSGVSPLNPGSIVRIEVEGIGTLENRIIKP